MHPQLLPSSFPSVDDSCQQQLPKCGQDQGPDISNVSDSSPVSDITVDLQMSDLDRQQVLLEVQRLEEVTIVAHVVGTRPSRGDLRHLLRVAFIEELDDIVDVQFLGKGCYQLELSSAEMVTFLLQKHAVAILGGWMTFYKWSHNFLPDQLPRDDLFCYTGVVVFPNLRKEWYSSLSVIAGTIGTVIQVFDRPCRQDGFPGAPAVKLLISRSAILPSFIALPNLVDSTLPAYKQKVLYRGLPNQCFYCYGFGHMAKACLKQKDSVQSVKKGDQDKSKDNRPQISTAIVPFQDPVVSHDTWIPVHAKKQGKKKKKSQQPLSKSATVVTNNVYTVLQHLDDSVQHQHEDVAVSSQSQELEPVSQFPFPKLVVGQPPQKISLVPVTSSALPLTSQQLMVVADKGIDMDVEGERKEGPSSGFVFDAQLSLDCASRTYVTGTKEPRSRKYKGKDLLVPHHQESCTERSREDRQLLLLDKRITRSSKK